MLKRPGLQIRVSKFSLVACKVLFKIGNNSTTAEVRKEININLESLEYNKFLNVGFTSFYNNQILLNRISHRFRDSQSMYWVKRTHKKISWTNTLAYFCPMK